MKLDKQSDDLLVLIEQEKLPFQKFDQINSLKFYCYYISKVVVETYLKLKEFDNLDLNEAILTGSNMIHHIFWILTSYTFNLQPTVFLVDRAILLYIQFIVMSRNPEMNNDPCYLPNISDALTFTYRKSIGPISAINLENQPNLERVRSSSHMVKMIVQYIFLFLVKPEEIKKRENTDFTQSGDSLEKKYLESVIDQTLNFLTNIIYQVYQKIPIDDHHLYQLTLPLFSDITTENFIYHLYLIKLLLTQTYNSYQVSPNWDEIREKTMTVMDIMKNSSSIVYEYGPDFPELEVPGNLTQEFKKVWDSTT